VQYTRIYSYCSEPFICGVPQRIFRAAKNVPRKIAKYRKLKKKRKKKNHGGKMKREYSFETQADHFSSFVIVKP